MIIKKLELHGPNLPVAEIDFLNLCTIVSGASDTGKTFIFECLKFMFGEEDAPKVIPESENYQRVLIALKINDKEVTLERGLRNTTYLYKDGTVEKNLSRKDLNDELLNLIGVGKKKVRKNKNNAVVALSFSYLRKYFFIDEVTIIDEHSPVVSEEVTLKTRDKSIFRLLLTGRDDSDLQEVDDRKIVAAKKSGSAKASEAIVNYFRSKVVNDVDITQELERCDNRIKYLTEKINESAKVTSRLLRRKQELFSKVDSINNQGLEVAETLKRFNLLKDAYQKDLSRLEFIGEGKHLLAQLPTGICPHCGGVMNHLHEGDTVVKTFDDNIINALSFESKKIRSLYNDLLNTIDDLKKEIERLKEDRSGINLEIENIESQIAASNKDSNESFGDQLKIALEERDCALEQKLIISQIDQISTLEISLDSSGEDEENGKEGEEPFGESASLFLLETEIENILEFWFKKRDKVSFDKETYDIVIAGRPRNSYGKGIRSIYRTAFHLGLMNLSIDKNLPHPRFLVIDSPLTAHEETDGPIETGIQNAFFDYFANYKKGQVIILENKEPSKEIQEKVKYYRFTGVKGIPRSGFFPPIS